MLLPINRDELGTIGQALFVARGGQLPSTWGYDCPTPAPWAEVVLTADGNAAEVYTHAAPSVVAVIQKVVEPSAALEWLAASAQSTPETFENKEAFVRFLMSAPTWTAVWSCALGASCPTVHRTLTDLAKHLAEIFPAYEIRSKMDVIYALQEVFPTRNLHPRFSRDDSDQERSSSRLSSAQLRCDVFAGSGGEEPLATLEANEASGRWTIRRPGNEYNGCDIETRTRSQVEFLARVLAGV